RLRRPDHGRMGINRPDPRAVRGHHGEPDRKAKESPAPMAQLCEVVITAPDAGWLKDFSRKLVEQRLCASAHNFAPVQPIYRWHGEIYERTEGRVSLHTRCDRVAEIIAL